MIDKELKQFYDATKEKVEYWLSLLFNSCGSPIEKKFIGYFYTFFIKNDTNIEHCVIFPKGMIPHTKKGDKILYTDVFEIVNEFGFALEFTGYDVKNSQDFNRSLGESFIYWGFKFQSSGIKYRVIPQYPVFDDITIKFLDFAIFAYDQNNKELARFDIECDGHAWHSTKEQLKADNIRSRFLSKNSFHPIRYSGSEIFEMNDNTILELENTMYKYIFKKESGLYMLRKY